MNRNVKLLRNFKYNECTFDRLYVITDSSGAPLILPLLYSAYLSQYGIVFQCKTIREVRSNKKFEYFEEREISDTTIRTYIYNLAKFLTYLEQSFQINHVGPHASSSCNERLVNKYLNEELAKSLKSHFSLETHRSSLMSYFNWLDKMSIGPSFHLKISRSTRQVVAEQNEKQHYIQYIPRYARTKLLNACTTLGEKLMMRMGYEVGLRTSEVAGLRLNGKGNLIELFNKLDDADFNSHEYFGYLLKGIYTKGGKSRWIYFDRDLLTDMKRYFFTEREWICKKSSKKSDFFFLRRDNKYAGTEISVEQASRVFRNKVEQAKLNPLLHFHDLRHTFATELYHSELARKEGRETRSESGALIVVAQRLGHSFHKNGQAPSTTTRYIRMRLHMMEMENEGA